MGGFNFRLGTYNVPSGSRPKHLETRLKAEFDEMDGCDGLNGISKVSLNFLHGFWEYRTCRYILVYKIKVAANIVMSFKI